MYRISVKTIVTYILAVIWIVCGFIDVYNRENYGSIIYKFFATVVFLFISTYYLLIDLDKINKMEKKKEKRFAILSIILIIAVAFIICGNYEVDIHRYNIKSGKIDEAFDGFRIVQVSDLHNAKFDKYNRTILEPIFHSHPDIIVITGDMIDSRNTNVDIAIDFAEKAVKIAPVYYVNGNHEARVSKDYEKLKKGLTEAGVTILENTSVDITLRDKKITVIGINSPTFSKEYAGYSKRENIINQLASVIQENDNFKVLLAHHPEYFDLYAGKVDLVFSGHAHGGQFKIPFLGGFIAPGQGFFPEYYEGSYIKDGTEMIVSRGIGNSIIPVRINNTPEIIIAELTKSSD